MLNSNKVTEITDGIFRVRSQYEPEKSYIVNLNHGDPYPPFKGGQGGCCNCPDGERTLFCKHRIASLLYLAAPRIGTVLSYALTNDAERLMDARSEQNDNTPSSSWQKLMECRREALNESRFDWIRSDLAHEGVIEEHQLDWQNEHYETVKQACAFDKSLFNKSIGDYWTIQKEYNWGGYVYSRRYRFWLIDNETKDLRQRCFWCEKPKGSAAQLCDELIPFERYEVKTSICRDCLEVTDDEMLTAKLRELYYQKPNAINTDGLPKPAEEFWKRVRFANLNQRLMVNQKLSQVSASKPRFIGDEFVEKCKVLSNEVESNDNSIEAAELPPMNGGGKRKVQMDKKLNTWIIEADGTKKEISCREICETFNDGSIITRLRLTNNKRCWANR